MVLLLQLTFLYLLLFYEGIKKTWRKEKITIIRLIGSFPSNILLMF